MNTEVRLLKLTNGEDIIAYVDDTNPNLYHLDNPLLMKIHSRPTSQGMQEGLHLSRWLQPFSEETSFQLERKHVVLSTEVSFGLNKYYEYSVKSFNREDEKEPTDEQLMEIALEEAVAEDEEELLSLEPLSKSIH